MLITIKRLIFMALVISSTTMSISFAEVVGYEAGVIANPLMKSGQYEYKEYAFITGEPILLTGTVTVPTISISGSKYTATYNFDLANTDRSMTISRKATYTVELLKDDGLMQTTKKVTLTKLDEKIVFGSDTYSLGRYTYSSSNLEDNTPAVDYMNGNLYLERVFYKNGDASKNSGKITLITTSDQLVGYKHKWGGLETRSLNQRILFEPPKGSTTASSWTGVINFMTSSVDKTSFVYQNNDPQNISFRGSYLMNKNQENVVKVTYDLPTSLKEANRNKGSVNLRENVVVTNTSLIAPKIRDIGSHYAERDIYLLSSLKIFDDYDKVTGIAGRFSPNTPITRMDFAKALAREIGDVKPLTKEEIIKRGRPGFTNIINYSDIAPTNPDITALEFLTSKHVIVGEGQYFYPDKAITRSEAVAMMVNALGLTELAPQPPYKIGYKDDAKIDALAISHKDAIYMGHEIGLLEEFKDGTFKPMAVVNRGDAAAMLNRMLTHIREKITVDYREKLVHF